MPVRHILIPIHDFSAGGTELVAFRLARSWLAAGRRVSILAGASNGPLRPRVPEGVEIHVLDPEHPRSALSQLSLGRRMAPTVRAIGPDAVFIPGNFHFMVAAAFKRSLPRAVIVAKASNPLASDNPWLLPVNRVLVNFALRGVDRVVAMADALVPAIGRFVDRERLAVIADPFLDDGTDIIERSGSWQSPPRLLTVARLEPQKDPALAIDVVAALHALGCHARLTIIGGGYMQATLQAQINRLGLTEVIELAGYVADPAPYYAAADMLLMTSRFEGVPAVIGEALVRGLPFVATDCSPWLEELGHKHRALGTVSATRDAGTLAAAVLAQLAQARPTAAQVDAAVAPHRARAAANAYLALFDCLTGG